MPMNPFEFPNDGDVEIGPDWDDHDNKDDPEISYSDGREFAD